MKTLRFAWVLCGLAWFTACSEIEDPQPKFETDLVEITSKTENGITITLYGSDKLTVGYNSITAKIENSDSQLISGEIDVMPMMDMMTMSHSCPLELPEGRQFKDGKYSFNPVFVMPSGDMGSWRIDFTINGSKISVPVSVQATQLPKLVSFTSMMDDETKYFVAFIDPKKPSVGKNDLEIAVYKKESMMHWPAVEGMQFEVEPWMVSMDHGSPNNVAPVHIQNGHYKGTVNFTMTGDWRVRLTMKDQDQVCGKPYFDLYFQ